jgi:spore maturation protein CgeB
MKIVFYGLTITSAWGNGHATTYRSLIKALTRIGHLVRFIEKDVEWYRSNRDLPKPEFCSVRLYDDWKAEESSLVREAADADAILIGSYFPDAIAATQGLLAAGYGPLLFYDIDTPITMSRLRATGACDYLQAAMIPHFSAYLSFTGGPVLGELERRFGSPRALPFYCSVDADLYRPAPVREEFRCDLSYLGTYAEDRQAKLMSFVNQTASLLPDKHFIVAGAKYPKSISWQRNIRRITHVSPPDHPPFYSSSRFTLNLTRKEMVASGYSPSVRLFEASACGAAIISDDWTGLSELLTPNEEILLPASVEDTADILTSLSDMERARIGQRAREKILAKHTSLQRAREFERIVAECTTSVTSTL